MIKNQRTASSISSSQNAVDKDSILVLPPLILYRRILRVHRNALPQEMRSLGDVYLKDEFRRCKSMENPIHIIGFLSQWKNYLDTIEQQTKESSKQSKREVGKKLSEDVLERLSSEQIGQLSELLKATKEIWIKLSDKKESSN
ncbi:hypothetical protein PPACK8108_LOCUS63 [Phakopsora pachyrhizi]|uniref:Succinate dehydrogenase assembly factor 3 n=1 Tax=Phakopsora pachyrhizi TaxID=170000 RepID=A0AAV0AFB8_PHAPC|nr:hypothetical protein PPACK8108_LOCUS63 [Phakopsora pachyrhizi]